MSNVVSARPYVRASAPEAVLASVIRTTPLSNELSTFELVDRARPYVAAALWLVVVLLTLALGARLYARYREENIPKVEPRAFDRKSLRRAAKAAAPAL